jgi:hypothetical protein
MFKNSESPLIFGQGGDQRFCLNAQTMFGAVIAESGDLWMSRLDSHLVTGIAGKQITWVRDLSQDHDSIHKSHSA